MNDYYHNPHYTENQAYYLELYEENTPARRQDGIKPLIQAAGSKTQAISAVAEYTGVSVDTLEENLENWNPEFDPDYETYDHDWETVRRAVNHARG